MKYDGIRSTHTHTRAHGRMHADGLCTEDGDGAQVSEPSRDAQARRNVRGDQH